MGENPKALERTLAKELGKIHRNFGRRCALGGDRLADELLGAAVTRG
jgi:hypothetical protein